jgi:hypothetical protein
MAIRIRLKDKELWFIVSRFRPNAHPSLTMASRLELTEAINMTAKAKMIAYFNIVNWSNARNLPFCDNIIVEIKKPGRKKNAIRNNNHRQEGLHRDNHA